MAWLHDNGDENELSQMEEDDGEKEGVIEETEEEVIVTERPGGSSAPSPSRASRSKPAKKSKSKPAPRAKAKSRKKTAAKKSSATRRTRKTEESSEERKAKTLTPGAQITGRTDQRRTLHARSGVQRPPLSFMSLGLCAGPWPQSADPSNSWVVNQALDFDGRTRPQPASEGEPYARAPVNKRPAYKFPNAQNEINFCPLRRSYAPGVIFGRAKMGRDHF